MTIDQLTSDDYLYFEALADSELLDAGEVGDFIKLCEQFIQHQDAQRFIGDIMMAAPIELRDAREIADAIKVNIMNTGQPVLGNLAVPSAPSVPQINVPVQQGQVRIPAQQQRPAPISAAPSRPVMPSMPTAAPKMNTIQQPPPMPPQPARELPKIPVGFTAFGPLNIKQQGTGNAAAQPVQSQPTQTAPMMPATPPQPQKSGTPQISVFSQKNISAPSPAVFPSNQGVMPEDTPSVPPAKTYEKGKDPYRETF